MRRCLPPFASLASARAAIAVLLFSGLAACATPEPIASHREAQPTTTARSSVWTDEVQLSRGNNGDGDIAAQGDFVHVIFGHDPLWYRRSTDGGETFSPPTVLIGGGSIHETDAIEAEGRGVFVLYIANYRYRPDWCCQRELGDLYVLRSTDSGATWEHPRPLTQNHGAFRQSIAVSDGAVHVVWSDFRSGAWEIYYRSSLDGGVTWGPEQRLARAAREEANRPQISALGNEVHITWTDNRDGNDRCYTMPHCGETYYIGSHDRGATWGEPRRLTFSRPVQPLAALRSDIASFSDGSTIVTFDLDPAYGSSGVQTVMRSPDGGATWLAPAQLVPGAVPEQTHPSAAALGLTGVIAWFDRRDRENDEIYASFSTDGGRSWGAEERVSSAPGESTTPHVALTGRFAHIVWLDGRNGGSEVFYRRRVLDPGAAGAER